MVDDAEGGGKTARSVVFLRESLELSQPYAVVRQGLCRDGDWLLQLARKAQETAGDGAALLLRVGPAVGDHHLGVIVQVRLGSPAARAGTCVMPIRWEADALSAVYPVLDGDLELSPLGPDRCRLTLTATYRPPLHVVGKFLDAVLLHKVAESTVRSFLEQVAATASSAPGAEPQTASIVTSQKK